MWPLIIFFFSSAFANEFRLLDSSSHFHLQISPSEIKFSSSGYSRQIPIKDCNRYLAQRLNSRILKNLDSSVKEGARLKVDNNDYFVKSSSELAVILSAVNTEIMTIDALTKKKCGN